MRSTSTVVRFDPRRLAVTVRRGVSRHAADAVFARAGVTPELAMPKIRAYMVRVAPDRRAAALAALRVSPLVAAAGKEPIVEAATVIPDDSDWSQQWGLRLAGFPEAWNVTRGSSRVVVAVVDTGVDPAQPELRGALVPGYDFVNSDADPRDDLGHGTAVAGIIAARANNRSGVAGVCWNCSIMPVKVLDAHGTGDDSVISAGIVWAVDHGARVVNVSLGGPGVTEDLTNALAYAAGKGAAVIAAAGNSGNSGLFYPAADPAAISVAATDPADRRYSWSNYGSWVRVAAPGCNVAPGLDGRDVIFCGTSSATPIVAGLAALAFSADPTAGPAAVAQALEDAAVPVPGVARYGRIDAPRTLALLVPPAPSARATTVFRGTIGGRTRSQVFSLPVGAGRVVTTLTFTGSRMLSLSLLPGERTQPIVRAKGRSPLRVDSEFRAGTIRIVVRGAKRAPFVLAVSYVRGAPG